MMCKCMWRQPVSVRASSSCREAFHRQKVCRLKYTKPEWFLWCWALKALPFTFNLLALLIHWCCWAENYRWWFSFLIIIIVVVNLKTLVSAVWLSGKRSLGPAGWSFLTPHNPRGHCMYGLQKNPMSSGATRLCLGRCLCTVSPLHLHGVCRNERLSKAARFCHPLISPTTTPLRAPGLGKLARSLSLSCGNALLNALLLLERD